MASKESKSCVKQVFLKVKPYASMVLLQISFAAMYVILMAMLKEGMNQSVMFVYRNVVAASVIAPLALFYERYEWEEMLITKCSIFD